eukprot:1416051-Prymnesium_polylepis.1
MGAFADGGGASSGAVATRGARCSSPGASCEVPPARRGASTADVLAENLFIGRAALRQRGVWCLRAWVLPGVGDDPQQAFTG